MPLPLNTITQAAFRASRFLGLGLAEMDDFALISSKNHFGGSVNPRSHLRKPVSPDAVRESRMLAWPVRLLDACPRSQGACAILISSELGPEGALARVQGWGRGHDSYWLGDRLGTMGDDVCELPALARAAREAYSAADIRDPRTDIDVVELYAPFSSLEMMMYSPLGLVDRGEERIAVADGRFASTGKQPVCPSGGCQTSNPIGATGLIRVAEAALQVAGAAGPHQVKNARRAIATSTGGASQYFSVVVLGEPN
jgi:acetyl-CoA C-acetyltransferase